MPDSNRLPEAAGLKAPLSCLSQARYGIGWGVVGAAQDCFVTARDYTILRKQFDDRPLASHQLVQLKLADMITEISKAQLLALHCGRLKDKGKLQPAHVFHAQAQQYFNRPRRRPGQPRPSGCQWRDGRISYNAASMQSGNSQDL